MKQTINEERPLHEHSQANPDAIFLILRTPINDEEHAHEQRYMRKNVVARGSRAKIACGPLWEVCKLFDRMGCETSQDEPA